MKTTKPSQPTPEREAPEGSSLPEEGDNTELRALIGQLHELPKPVWILAGGMFVNRFGTFVVPFLLLYMEKQQFENWKGLYALTMVAMACGGIISAFLGGWLADRIGRRHTMGISLFSAAVSMLLLWQAYDALTFALAGFGAGLAHALYHPASHSLLVDVVPVNRRVTAFAVVRWALNLGFAFGMAAGGFLAEKSYALLFIGDACTSMIFGVIVLTSLPHGIRATRHESRWKPAIASILSNRPFLAFWAANLLVVGLYFQWAAAVSKLVLDLGYTEMVYGWIMALNGLMITVFELPLSQICRRFTPQKVIGWGFFFCGIGMSLHLFAVSWVWIVIATVVFTVGEMVSMPISSAYVSGLAPEKMRGRYTGVLGLTWHFGHAFAPALGVVLYTECPEALWIGSAFCGLAAAGIIWRVK